jgi:hypothetical protein
MEKKQIKKTQMRATEVLLSCLWKGWGVGSGWAMK